MATLSNPIPSVDPLAGQAAGAEPPLIEACALSKNYGQAAAVRNLSFSVRRGEVVGFLGPNGAGKSTTMKMLTGFLRPSAGLAKIGGTSVADDPLAVRRSLGYLPENAPLYDDMMVIDFLGFIADLRGVRPPLRDRRIEQSCRRCGLMSVLGKDIGQLSKGYRQRVGLAQTLLHDPDLLILDEPTSGLDPNQIIEIRELIRDLGRDKTVMLSTHILSEVHATCDRVLIINDGRLVADGRPEELSGAGADGEAVCRIDVTLQPRPEAQLSLAEVGSRLAAVPGITRVETVAGATGPTGTFVLHARQSPDVRPALFDLAVACQLVLLDMHRHQNTLEQTFRRLTRTALPPADTDDDFLPRRGPRPATGDHHPGGADTHA